MTNSYLLAKDRHKNRVREEMLNLLDKECEMGRVSCQPAKIDIFCLINRRRSTD
jgi:hypothetical protein